MNYQRIIQGSKQHIGKQYDYFIFTYYSENHEWRFTGYIDLKGFVYKSSSLNLEYLRDSFVLHEASQIIECLYMNSGSWMG